MMASRREMLSIIINNGKKRMIIKSPLTNHSKIVLVINNQFTNAPNTTQIASGAGRSSAAGSNAAVASSNTNQQQSVGASGKAKNIGLKGNQSIPYVQSGKRHRLNEIHVLINNQIAKRPKGSQGITNSSATQIASGGGTYSTGGTNSAIESSNTKQQHAVGGGKGSLGKNKMLNLKSNSGRRRRRR